MKVLLISANTETIYMVIPPVGLACVAAATRQAGHEVKVLDLLAAQHAADAIRRAVGDFRPEVIGISIRNIDDQNMKQPSFLLEGAKEAVVKALSDWTSAGFPEIYFVDNTFNIMNKRFRPGEIRQASRILSDHGIRQMGFLLLGGPGETKETVEESLAFVDSLPGARGFINLRISCRTSLRSGEKADTTSDSPPSCLWCGNVGKPGKCGVLS